MTTTTTTTTDDASLDAEPPTFAEYADASAAAHARHVPDLDAARAHQRGLDREALLRAAERDRRAAAEVPTRCDVCHVEANELTQVDTMSVPCGGQVTRCGWICDACLSPFVAETEPFCACGRPRSRCDGSRAGCRRIADAAQSLRALAVAVAARGLRWALVVPTEPGDDEWVVRLRRVGSTSPLGQIEIVADTLERALEIAASEVDRVL